MSRILFGQAYYLRFDRKLRDEMRPYPPLGTLYAAAYLRRSHGYNVALFDAMLAASEREWDDALDEEKPEFAILYEDNFNYLTKMCLLRMREAAITMIGMARQRGCTVIVCSSDASDHAKRYLAAGADYILVGEGEETLGELMDCLTGRAHSPLHEIEGLAFSDPETNTVVQTPRRKVMKNIDALPWPAWDLVDIDRYREIWKQRHGYFSLNMVTSRGCPFHCNWCAKPIWGQRYHARSPEDVVAEMQWLTERYKPDHLWFMDDMMGIKPGWISRFAELVKDSGTTIPFKCLNRVDLLLRNGEIDALRRAGCQIVWTGVESGSQTVLDAMDKGITVEQIREASQRLHDAGIDVGFFIQFGYPGETLDDIEKTFQLVRDCRPDQIGVSVSYPLPGTPFFNAVKTQLGDKQNWVDSDDLDMMYEGPFATTFYRKLHRTLHKEFRARKAWHTLQPALRRPSRLRKTHLREAAAMAYHGATLPFARLQVERLARLPHRGIEPLPDILTLRQASTPSPY